MCWTLDLIFCIWACFVFLGPLHMSSVTELAWFLGQILFSVHMGNFSSVDRDEIQETKPKWWNINLYHLWLLYSFVDCFNLITTSVVKKHSRQKLCHFFRYVAIIKNGSCNPASLCLASHLNKSNFFCEEKSGEATWLWTRHALQAESGNIIKRSWY